MNESNGKIIMNFIITESGDNFLRQIIHGIPIISTVGIISGDNNADVIENYFRRGNFAFFQISSSHRSMTNTFIVFNIDEPYITEMCGDCSKSYIIGEINHGKWCEFTRIENGKMTGKRFMMSTDAGIIKSTVNSIDFHIPLFDDNNVGIEIRRTNLDNPNRIAYDSDEISSLNLTTELSADLKRIIEMNRIEPVTGRAQWLRNGINLKILHRLHAIFAQQN